MRSSSGGAGIRGSISRRTGTPFIRAVGSSSRCATSAADTRQRVEGISGLKACGNRRRYRPCRMNIWRRCRRFSPRRDCTAAASVLHAGRLSAAITTSSQNRLRFWVRCALPISVRSSVDRNPVEHWSGRFAAHEMLLVVLVSAAGVPPRRTSGGGGELEADDRRFPQRDLGAGDLLHAAVRRAARRPRGAGTRRFAAYETASHARARAAPRRAAGECRRAGGRPGRRGRWR